jgi:hemoglobin-like flavoprotein
MTFSMASLTEVTESFKRCLADPDFLDHFFDNLLRALPEVAPLFVDMGTPSRNAIIRKGVTTIFMWEAGSKSAAETLARLHHTHGPEGKNIQPEMFLTFQRVFLETVHTFDPQITPEVELAWRILMKKGIDQITTF